MRDEKRIKKILGLIENIWSQYPDMRLGQLLINFGGFQSYHDNFSVEDTIVEKSLLGHVQPDYLISYLADKIGEI